MDNDNKDLNTKNPKKKNEFFVNKLEKNSELGEEIKDIVGYTIAAISGGLLSLGFMVANCVNTFSADFGRPIFAVLAVLCGGFSFYAISFGLKALIGIISTLAGYVSGNGDIKEEIDLLQKYVKRYMSSETNENNNDDEKGKGL